MLHVHRSERADALVAPLADVLATPPDDPFTPDVVAVPTRGVERWLAQRLSHHLGAGADGEAGIAANIRFDSPGRLLDEVAHAVLPSGRAPDDDPWSRDRLTWHVLGTVDACAHEEWCAPLARHLGLGPDGSDPDGSGPDGPAPDATDDVRQGRRMQAAAHLAALFASYAAQRPGMLEAWARGRDDDGGGAAVPPDLAWQVRLWHELRERVGEPGPAERADDLVERLLGSPTAVDLPARLSVFGATRLPAGQLRLLEALAADREVHLWLPHPSPTLWAAVARTASGRPGGTAAGRAGGAAAGRPGGTEPLRRREVAVPARHPLLASMARDVTELQLRLSATGGQSHHHPAPDLPTTLLGALQQRLRDDASDAPPLPVAPDDRTVQVHACHGRARQVEVLREALIGLFDADPTLEPRDVVVLCPDVEAVAPLVAATFGLPAEEAGTEVHPGRSLRVRLADRSLRQTNPLLSLLARLLELADGRVTASDVVDLVGSEPVRRRFRLDDDDVDRVREWAVTSGARWGEDRARRERFGLGHVLQGTWDAALDRLALGVAMAEEDERYVGLALPLDDVDSTDVDLVGRLTEVVDRLALVLGQLDGTRPATAWLDTLDHALDLLGGTAPADAWQQVEARAVLDEARRGATASGDDAPLRLADVRALLARRLRGRPTRAGFRTGALTMCSMEPMRAVPHRVVVLLGMDDGAFPRGTRTDGDDLLLRDPWVGERDRRSEDRQLFLDALGAATEHLVVLYSGADERTGASRPPAVPVSELLDALDAAAATADGRPAREHVVVRHPLQTVDERNFADGALGTPGPFSYDAVARRAAEVARGPRGATTAFLARPLPADPALLDGVDLSLLTQTVEHPVRAFLRRRLGVQLAGRGDDVEDALPLELDGLRRWQVGDRLLAAALRDAPLGPVAVAERLRGVVPPGQVGGAVLRDLREQVVPLVDAVRGRRPDVPAASVDLTVTLPSGRTLSGTVTGLHGEVLVRPVFSKLAAKYRLRAWVGLLAVAAAEPGRLTHAVAVGRSPKAWAGAAVSRLRAPDRDEALTLLDRLVELHDAALLEPLPLPLATACAYAQARTDGDDEAAALGRARAEWSGAYEHTDDWHAVVWGDAPDLDAVLAQRPGPGERWTDDATRLGVLARRLWDPVHAHEQVTHE